MCRGRKVWRLDIRAEGFCLGWRGFCPRNAWSEVGGRVALEKCSLEQVVLRICLGSFFVGHDV